MPTCQNCHYTWSYTEALKKMFTVSAGKICPHCKEKQYATKKTASKVSYLILFSIVVALVLAFTLGASLINVAILILLFSIYVLIYPLILELQNEETKH